LSKKLVLISGPTASGKTKLAIKIAQKINGEIINADSMQVYKEFLVLSSRPTESEIKKIKHHLYGFISVKKYFSAGEWLVNLKKKIKICEKNKTIPVIVGGTGLYFKAITDGISKIPKIKKENRKTVRELHQKIGQENFYKKLIILDPLIKKKFHQTDTHRSMRAYEVKLETKKSLYEWSTHTKSNFLDYDIKKFFIDIPRDELLKKISKRTEKMFKNNCVEEVKNFLNLKLDKSLSSNKLIGINEISGYLLGSVTLDRVKELIAIKTRQYAKRQKTWSRGHMKNWHKLYFKDLPTLEEKILKLIS